MDYREQPIMDPATIETTDSTLEVAQKPYLSKWVRFYETVKESYDPFRSPTRSRMDSKRRVQHSQLLLASSWLLTAKGLKPDHPEASALTEGFWMSGEFEEKFIKPIVNSAYPATLAGLDLAVLQFSSNAGPTLDLIFLVGAGGFLTSAFSVFFYTIYPTRRKIWTTSALSFIAGLVCSIVAVLILIVRVFAPTFLM